MWKRLTVVLACVLLLLLCGVELQTRLLAGHGHSSGGGPPPPVNGTAAGDRAVIMGSTQTGANSVATGTNKGYRWGAGHGHRYGETAYRAPVSPDKNEDQVNYEQRVKEDPFFERPHVPGAVKAVVDNLIEKMAGVHSEERKQKAEQSVDKLADMGEQASLKICEYAEGQDVPLSIYCLKVMDKAWFVRYEPILLNMLETRGDLPKDLGDAALGVFAKHADASTLSGLLHLMITEKNPAYVKDICPILWKLQTPALWRRVLKFGDAQVNGDKDMLSLMELREVDTQRKIARIFSADDKPAAAGNDDDISIGLARSGASDEMLSRQIAAMVVAWSARPELAKSIDAMAHDSDDTVTFYGLVAQAHLRNDQCLVPLIDYLGSERWDIRRDAEAGLSELTGTTLDYDFASVRAERVKGFSRWLSFARLKNASKDAGYPASEGWKELTTHFVTEPRSVLFDTDTAFHALGEAGTDFLTPGVVEGRWESVPISNALGKLPLHLEQQTSMLFRVDVDKHIVSTAMVKDNAEQSQPVNFERILTAAMPTPTTPVNLGNKQPCAMLKLDYAPLPAAARAYSFATYEKSTRTVPYMRAGYVEATFDDVTFRVYDDDNNGDFNDYGSDAFQFAGQRYATLLSSTVNVGKQFFEFRISRSGDKMWVKPYEGALGSIHIKLPELNGFKAIDLQVQSGSRVFDITGAVNMPMPLPVGKYQIVHAAVAVASSRALVTEGPSGYFEVEANKVTEKSFADKLTVQVQPEVIDECDICSLKSKYPVPKGGQVLKIHVPHIDDGGQQTYGRFDSKLARVTVECSAPSGRKLFSSAWNPADDGFLPFYFVLPAKSMENGNYKITMKMDLAPFGQIKGEGSFSPPDGLIQVRP